MMRRRPGRRFLFRLAGSGASLLALMLAAAPAPAREGRVSAVPPPIPRPQSDPVAEAWWLQYVARAYERTDPGRSESCWAALARTRSVWTWEAARRLAEGAITLGDSAHADSIIAKADLWAQGAAESAGRLNRLAALRAARGDTAGAARLCRQAIRVYPSESAAESALVLLDRLAARGEDSTRADDARLGAEVEFLNGDRAQAIDRLSRVFAVPTDPIGWRGGLRLAEMQRLTRRLGAARVTLQRCDHLAPDREAHARVTLERARVLRDSDRPDSAFQAFARVAARTTDNGIAESAWWEYAREAEERSRWAEAKRAYARVVGLDGKRADDAEFRLGVLAVAEHRARRARSWFARASGDRATFWWAIAARDSSRAAANRALKELARRPGFDYYRSAARESLGGSARESLAVVLARPYLGCAAPVRVPALETARLAIAAGDPAGARTLLAAWAAGDPRTDAPGAKRDRPACALMAASALIDSCERPGDAIRYASRAFGAFADSGEQAQWSATRAVYPRRFETRIAHAADRARPGLDPALIQALIWKESHFDSSVISVAGAVGLMQLMPATARGMAAQLQRGMPSDSDLMQPELNILLGARYFGTLLDRFSGKVPLALAAYNAGVPAAQRWRDLAPRADDALLCELIEYPETQGYVKGILGARSAYRAFAGAAAASR